MKSLCVVLLVAAACVEQVHSMWCFRCENEPSNWNCVTAAKCAETDKYCVTTTQTSGHGNNSVYRVSKRCSDVCPDNNMNQNAGAPSINCCSFSFCNISGATSVKTSTAVTALGILASLFYIFRSGL